MAIQEFRLPDPGEGLVEADIVTWRVAVGDEVKINDIVVEVETSKSLVELPSPYAGTVTGLLVSEGDTVDVGVADHRHRRRGRRGTRAGRATTWSRRCREPSTAATGGRRRRGAGRAGRRAGRLRPEDHRGQAAAAQDRAGRARAGRGARAGRPAPSPPTPRCRGGPTIASRCSRRPAQPQGGPLPGTRTRGAGDGAAVGRCGAGQAAGTQAGQGSRRRPRRR